VRPLNLATEPFRNQRGPALAFVAAGLLVGLITIVHGRVLFRLLQPGGTDVHRRVAALDGELARLQQLVAEDRKTPPPDKAQLERWVAIKDLVDRRTFSWTRLLAHFEELLPIQVRLVSIAPTVKNGRAEIKVSAIARPANAGLELIDVLQGRGPFAEVYPVGVTDRPTGAAFEYTMTYREPLDPRPAPAAQPVAQQTPPPGSRPPGPEPFVENVGPDDTVDDGADDSEPQPPRPPASMPPRPGGAPPITQTPQADEEEES
jgi:hypothetical protein